MPIEVIKPNPSWEKFSDDIIDSYDLTICRAMLINPPMVIADEGIIVQRTGKILRIGDPLRTLNRVLKYRNRGVGFNDHEFLKVLHACRALPAERKQTVLELARVEAFPTDSHNDDMSWEDDDDNWFRGNKNPMDLLFLGATGHAYITHKSKIPAGCSRSGIHENKGNINMFHKYTPARLTRQ